VGELETASRHGIFLVDVLLGEIRLRNPVFSGLFLVSF